LCMLVGETNYVSMSDNVMLASIQIAWTNDAKDIQNVDHLTSFGMLCNILLLATLTLQLKQ
jgi:hypothetical protein